MTFYVLWQLLKTSSGNKTLKWRFLRFMLVKSNSTLLFNCSTAKLRAVQFICKRGKEGFMGIKLKRLLDSYPIECRNLNNLRKCGLPIKKSVAVQSTKIYRRKWLKYYFWFRILVWTINSCPVPTFNPRISMLQLIFSF